MIYSEDIQLAAEDMFGSDNIDLQDLASSNPELIIHWDEIEVSNENDDKHTIYDMYAKVTFSSGYELIGFKLTRSTLTIDELKAHYVFSHLPKMSTNLDYSTPCIGSGPIRNTMSSLAKRYDSDLFRLFLVELDRYVRTESLTGVPYIRMSEIGITYSCRYDVGSVNANRCVDGKAIDLYDYIRRECPITPIKVSDCVDFGDLYKLVRIVSFAAINYINTLNASQRQLLINNFFSVASVYDGIIYIGIQSDVIDPNDVYLPVVFKGKHITFKIKDSDVPQRDMYVVRSDIMSGVLSLMYLDYYTNEFEENDGNKEIES